ncbi:MAG: hypothetical protein SVM80_08500 [Halobacteriota archaeon]|nr:hypothetical protein [Halobacteriota archaeon]
MTNLKFVFGILAIISAIIIAMPGTVSIFGGQHQWYDLKPAGNQVPCQKCHADIAEELASSGSHADIGCDGCHRTDLRVGHYAAEGYGDLDPGQGAHAASTEECMICHDGKTFATGTNFTHENLNCSTSPCHGTPWMPPPAGGFGLTVSAPSPDTGEKAAHLAFVSSANESSGLMESENEACIACHTNASVGITYTIPHRYEIELNRSCDWEVGNFTEGNYTEVIA